VKLRKKKVPRGSGLKKKKEEEKRGNSPRQGDEKTKI